MNKVICPVCMQPAGELFLPISQVPVHQHLLCQTPEEARAMERGTLSLAVCHTCGFIWNSTFESDKIRYGQNYDNNQAYSHTFKNHLEQLQHRLIHEKGIQHHHIVEIGCGDGSFLRQLVNFPGSQNQGYGFDPSYKGPAQAEQGRLQFFTQYYNETAPSVPADVVICRHVIEHIPSPLPFLIALQKTLSSSQGTSRVFFETPRVEWILEHHARWDFFYEHCCYFSMASIHTLFSRAGFVVQSLQPIFNEQYLWLEAEVSPQPIAATPYHPQEVLQLAKSFQNHDADNHQQWQALLHSLSQKGPIALWGAGAKGVTFAGLMDPEQRYISCVVDLNPHKQGQFLPGTGHPIVAYQELKQRNIVTAILMNPNYLEENTRLLQQANLEVELVVI